MFGGSPMFPKLSYVALLLNYLSLTLPKHITFLAYVLKILYFRRPEWSDAPKFCNLSFLAAILFVKRKISSSG